MRKLLLFIVLALIPCGVGAAQPLSSVSIVNESNCDVVASLDGGGADNLLVRQKSAKSLSLGRLRRQHSRNINIRGQSACTAGNVYVTGNY